MMEFVAFAKNGLCLVDALSRVRAKRAATGKSPSTASMLDLASAQRLTPAPRKTLAAELMRLFQNGKVMYATRKLAAGMLSTAKQTHRHQIQCIVESRVSLVRDTVRSINMTDPKPRGGSRPGSGRKPDPNARKMVSLRLSLETVDYLSTVENKTEAIEQAVKNSKAFKAWKANRPKTAKGG